MTRTQLYRVKNSHVVLDERERLPINYELYTLFPTTSNINISNSEIQQEHDIARRERAAQPELTFDVPPAV